MAQIRPLSSALVCAALAASLTACTGPTEFQSADELAAFIESYGIDCPDPARLGNYHVFECENVKGYWSAERPNIPSPPKRGKGRGSYIDNNQRAITTEHWIVYSIGEPEDIRAGNEIINRIADDTNTKAFDMYW